jgi:hypothetical protein
MPGKERLVQIVSMLVGLIRSNSADRVYEGEVPYGDGKAGVEIKSATG